MKFLDNCLTVLADQTFAEREFILVDNGLTDGSRDLIARWGERLPYAQAIVRPNNTGFCRADNLAFARARGAWIALFNTDASAEPAWLEKLVRAHSSDLPPVLGQLRRLFTAQGDAGRTKPAAAGDQEFSTRISGDAWPPSPEFISWMRACFHPCRLPRWPSRSWRMPIALRQTAHCRMSRN